MLQAFRSRGLTSVVYGVIIVGMVLVFVLGFNPTAGKKLASVDEQCAARVKGHCITPKDHLAAYRILIPRGPQGEPLTAKAKQMGLLRTSLEGLIERELLVSDADRLGIAVTDDEVTDEIYDGFVHVSVPSDDPGLAYSLKIPEEGKIYMGFRDPKTKRFEVKVYERAIKAAMGRSPTEFREEQVRELTAAKVRDMVRVPIRVGEPEALAEYIDQRSTATIETISVKQTYVARYMAPPSDKDVDAWAKDPANAKTIEGGMEVFKTPHIRHILIKVDATASDAEKAAAKERIDKALDRVKHGEAFAAVAKEVSQDPGSAARGGDVGDKTDGFVPAFRDAADKLKPGEMTQEPVLTQFGYHIIMREAPRTEEAIRHDVARDMFAMTQASEATKTMAERLEANLKNGMDPKKACETAIATLPAPPAPAPAKPAATAAPKDGKAAPAPVSSVDRPDTDPARPQVVTSSPFNRGGDPIPALSPDTNARLIKFAFGAKDGERMDQRLPTDDGFVLVSLKEHKQATKEAFDKEKDTFLQGLVARKQAEALALYVKRLREVSKAEIKIDEKYLAEKMGAGQKSVTDGGAPIAPAEEDEEEGN